MAFFLLSGIRDLDGTDIDTGFYRLKDIIQVINIIGFSFLIPYVILQSPADMHLSGQVGLFIRIENH